MRSHLIVTITCPDRPGIVERITEALVGHSANWEESRFARLGGDFAGIVRLSVPRENAAALTAALTAMADNDLAVLVKQGQAPAALEWQSHRLCGLRLSGADHEGIVHKVAAYLASRHINVDTMETEVVCAPMSAAPLFQMVARIQVPPGLPLDDLTADLQQIGDELGVDIEISPEATGNH